MSTPKKPKEHADLSSQIREECLAMARYALSTGMEGLEPQMMADLGIAPPAHGAEEGAPTPRLPDPKRMAEIHNTLAKIVQPARPGTIVLVSRATSKAGTKGVVILPFVLRMLEVAVLFTILFVGFRLLVFMADKEMVGGNLYTQRLAGMASCDVINYLIAAALGASLAALFEANTYTENLTFDPKYESSYWIRFVVGIISGLVFATLLGEESSAGQESLFSPDLVALLGGFSSKAVYAILNRLVATLETMVVGNAQARQEAQAGKEKIRLAQGLMELRKQMGEMPPEAMDKMDKMLGGLFSGAGQ